MVYAFIIQTLDPEEPELAYYRFYSAWKNNHYNTPEVSDGNGCLFESSIEKKELLYFIIKKVHMLYSLKLKQSLIPIQNQDMKTLIKGSHKERHWKTGEFNVVWEGVPGIGFSIIFEKDGNILHTQNVLGLIVSELEKYLQLVSYPSATAKTLDNVALIVEKFLPGGQLLFLNSSLVKSLEKQLEADLKS
uniref:Uncharacterized protein n=1 Tax=Graphocephala atropunctata TaxID=36148 RepID=A0A1B6L068_9HEMI